MTADSALTAARETGLVAHSSRCSSSGLASCTCRYQARLQALADRFERFAEIDPRERTLAQGVMLALGTFFNGFEAEAPFKRDLLEKRYRAWYAHRETKYEEMAQPQFARETLDRAGLSDAMPNLAAALDHAHDDGAGFDAMVNGCERESELNAALPPGHVNIAGTVYKVERGERAKLMGKE